MKLDALLPDFQDWIAPVAGTAMAFDVKGITERMTSLTMDASEVFKATVTPEALKAWE